MSDIMEQAMRAAAQRFPWYAGMLDGEAEDRPPPLLTASVLEQHLYVPSAEADQDAFFSAYRTSGTSTGIRRTIYYSEADERHYIEIKARLFQNWLQAQRVEDDAAVRTVLIDMGTGHAAATAMEVFAEIGLNARSLPFTLPIEQHLDGIIACQPDLLYTMPSLLDRIVQSVAQPHKLGIRKVILVGEVAPPAWQRHIAHRLGITPGDLLDTYGSIEVGTIAAYSHEMGRYVLAEGLHAEGVAAESLNEGFEPLSPNESVLTLTSAVREAFPVVRYVTYDVVRDLRTDIVDGTVRQTFEAIVKRIGPELKHGEKISLYDIEEAVLPFADDASVRVQVQGRQLKVQVTSGQLTEHELPAVRHAIEDRIPEIGEMIRGGLLERIEVSLISGVDKSVENGRSIKTRKIFYEMPDQP